MGNKLVDIEARIRKEEQRVLAELSDLVAQDEPVLNSLVEILLALDLALARGVTAVGSGLFPPIFRKILRLPSC
jgi:DNA mismatch repair protein MutS2